MCQKEGCRPLLAVMRQPTTENLRLATRSRRKECGHEDRYSKELHRYLAGPAITRSLIIAVQWTVSSMGTMRDPVSGQWYWFREFDEDEELQPHEQLWMNFVEMTPEDSGEMALEDIPVHSDEVDEASSDSERIGSASTTTPDDEASGSWPGATLPVVPDEAEVENRDDDEEASVEGSTDLEESSSGIARIRPALRGRIRLCIPCRSGRGSPGSAQRWRRG